MRGELLFSKIKTTVTELCCNFFGKRCKENENKGEWKGIESFLSLIRGFGFRNKIRNEKSIKKPHQVPLVQLLNSYKLNARLHTYHLTINNLTFKHHFSHINPTR